MTGSAGPPGPQGTKGETGVRGPRGYGTSGLMSFYKNWKECAGKDLNDDKEHGLIKVNDYTNLRFFLIIAHSYLKEYLKLTK